MVHGVFDPQYQGYGEKFLVRSYLNMKLNKIKPVFENVMT